jgi:hypothetical protein
MIDCASRGEFGRKNTTGCADADNHDIRLYPAAQAT